MKQVKIFFLIIFPFNILYIYLDKKFLDLKNDVQIYEVINTPFIYPYKTIFFIFARKTFNFIKQFIEIQINKFSKFKIKIVEKYVNKE